MFQRFTRYGRASIAQAGEEARRLNRSSVDPEHIFLALVRCNEGVAGRVLAQLGVTLDAARETVEAVAGRGDQPVRGELPFSAEGKKVLELALGEAKRLRHNYIGTEHLLLALLLDVVDTAPVVNVMHQFQLNPERVLELIMAELGERLHVKDLASGWRLGWGRWVGRASSLTVQLESRTSPSLRTEGTRNNVVMCRVSNSDLDAIDTLVEAGVRVARSDAAAWLIRAGIDANKSLFERLEATVREIRRLREQAQEITREVATGENPSKEPGSPPSQGEAH